MICRMCQRNVAAHSLTELRQCDLVLDRMLRGSLQRLTEAAEREALERKLAVMAESSTAKEIQRQP